MSTLAFGAACGLLCHSNRRSTSQRPLLFIGVGAALALTGSHQGEGGILWNTTVPAALITAMLLSRILDIIYNWLRVPATDRSMDK
ncbi:hypothetical protein BU25DRAFT_91560 [Macroventuria anomochaeta]|uniref:Uncharacterized protein n=1 Tax=Macroventuria anomochaeta TaxID=301207 RepID=A0ACB6RZM8_9PLEO|nr:uncharacterized protein BU25DRAFT_91560 [Macroventuria anomochaeta]KAF2626609.1 hypothetical protein BU25DRAFT_91560 [Macroventuria anomochaeta]